MEPADKAQRGICECGYIVGRIREVLYDANQSMIVKIAAAVSKEEKGIGKFLFFTAVRVLHAGRSKYRRN